MKYRSKLEKRVAASLGTSWEYESHSVDYIVEHTYTPDFTKGDIHIEVKGFWRPNDLKKYLSINKVLRSEGQELFFIFSNPSKPQRRGAKMTMGQWCDKHSIRYCSAAQAREFFDAK
jgi:hypothetical protein